MLCQIAFIALKYLKVLQLNSKLVLTNAYRRLAVASQLNALSTCTQYATINRLSVFYMNKVSRYNRFCSYVNCNEVNKI